MGNWCITNQRPIQDSTEYISIISVFVGNHKMVVLVGESGKWEARCKRIKDTAQHTSCLLQSSDTMAISTYITDVTNTEYTRCTLRHNRQQNYHQWCVLIFTHEHNYLKEEEKGTQIFHRRKMMTRSRAHPENPKELGATGKKCDLSPFRTYRW